MPARLAILVAFPLLAAPAQADVLLVDAGRPVATIVTRDHPSEQTAEAASLLQKYLEKISGARLDIRAESRAAAGTHIFVGPGPAVRHLGITVPAGSTYRMDEEGYVSKTRGGHLVLAGNEDPPYRGTLYAVADFLEELGCRWFFPGDFGEVVPRRETIQVPERDRLERPDFRFRNIWLAGGYPLTQQDVRRFAQWRDRNKVAPLAMSLPGDGTISRLAPPEKYFATHPHVFALNKDGTRNKQMLCMSDEDAVRIAVETIDAYFRDHPRARTFGFAPPDGFPMCYCKRCQDYFPGFSGKGYGDPSMSELWFQFANKIARRVYEKYPDRWVLTNGYANRVRPPEGSGPLSPNLGIQSAVISACTLHRIGDPKCWQRRLYRQLIDRWANAVDCLFIYDYEPGISLANLPFPALHNLSHDMRYFKDRGIWGFWTESGNAWMVTHLNCYVRAKLMWDVDRDVHALVHDYCANFYEDAAEPVEQYMWTLERAVEKTHLHVTWGRLMRWEVILADVIERLDRLMARAEASARTATAKRHLRMLRLTHDHMKAYVAMEEAAREGRFAESVRWGEKMLALRDEAETIAPGFLAKTPDFRKSFRTTIEWHIAHYQALADRMGGAEGELVLLLPRTWKFKKDPRDIGVLYQWYNAAPDSSWEDIDTTLYWEAQGHVDKEGWGYTGNAWYQIECDLPPSTRGRPIWLTIGAVYNRGVWLWVNGRMVKFELHRHHRLGHHGVRAPIHADVTGLVKPGKKNKIAVLVHTDPPGRNPRGGIHRRCFLWTPRSR